LMILGFNQFLISMILYLRSNLLGLHLFKSDSIVSVLDRFIMIIFCGMLLWTNITGAQIDIMNFVYTQTISYVLTAIIAFIMVMKNTTHFKLSWNWPFSLMILKKSFPFAVLVLLMTFYNRLDTVMIERLLPTNNIYIEKIISSVKHDPVLYANEAVKKIIDAEELKQSFTGAGQAGIYTKGFRLLDAANMIAFLFAMQLLPTFSRMIKYKESVEQLVKLSFTLLMTPALIIAISCLFYSQELTSLINHGNTNSAPVFGILMCCFAAISTTYIFGTLLTANGNLKQLNIMALTGICINLVLNLILIPKMNAYGSAISSLVTQFFTAIVQIILAARIFKFRINKRLLIQLFLFISGVICFNIFTCKLSFFWMINFSLMCGLCGIWAFVIGLINVKSILRFLKYS
jgi:O-antigen/teichoic acid export membrane protein